jgi:alkylation response protein AidB-like acyl-CoA dehydrogenase
MALDEHQVTTAAELIARAQRLRPLVEEHADAAEAQGLLTDEVIEGFQTAGIIGTWTPRSVGGHELGPVTGSQIIEVLSHADSSSGWVAFVHMAIGAMTGAYVGDEAAAEIFATDRMPLISGQGTRPGVAVPADGGYVVSGSWSFGSGMKHAGWTHNLVQVQGTDTFLITTGPVADATLAWDSWDTLGLRATGSIDYVIESAYVPEAFTFPAAAMSSSRGGPLYKLGIMGIISSGHAAWALGTVGRMLDELRAYAAAHQGRVGTQADNPAFLGELAAATGKHRAARALFYDTWHDVEETLARGDDLSPDQETGYRLALAHTTWTCLDVANWVVDAAATVAIRRSVLQRHFRDMKTGAQHMTSGPTVRQNVGRMLVGAGAQKRWAFTDLVDSDQGSAA